jgi:hypothetical protein
MMCKHTQYTFIAVDTIKRLHEQVGATAGDVNKRALLAEPETRSYCQTLRDVSIVI